MPEQQPDGKQQDWVVIRGGTVMCFDAEDRTLDGGEVWFTGGEIRAVGPAGSFAPPEGAAVTAIEAAGRLVLPGMINAHSHSYTALLKGTVDAVPLDLYMIRAMAGGSDRTPREIFVSAQVDCLTLLKCGITAVIDHYSERPALTREGLEAVAAGYREAGLRARIAPMFADLPYLETVPLAPGALPDHLRAHYESFPRPDPEYYFAVIERAIADLETGGGRIGLLYGVDGPQRCSRALIEMTADAKRRTGLGLHTHMLEAKTQAAMRAPEAAEGFVARLARLGIIDQASSFAHFVWSAEDDIAAAREAGVTIIHPAPSNMMLGSGVCPMLRLVAEGIPVAFGSDGSNCNPAGLLETIRVATYLSRVTEPNPDKWIDAPGMLRLAMTGGARAMGEPGRIGTLAPGARADIVVIDTRNHWHRPMGDPWRHLLFYEQGGGTEHVWIDGAQVVRDGRVLTIDEEAILAEAEEIARGYAARMGGREGFIAEHHGPFRDMVIDAHRRDIGIERLIRLE